MNIKSQVFLATTLFASLVYSYTASAQQTVVGSIPAEFTVSGGQASYSIPIQVALGRGGMQPDLSLNYSGGGNGVLGVGWNLGGLSSIHRCSASLDQDGFIAGITFTEKDRYCLDGQRLVPVSGSNGGVSTEYKTEIDGYSQIKSYGGTANNPDYWVAKTKAGQVITFGGGNASYAFPGGTTTWSVKNINDTTGNNTITYDYSTEQNKQYLSSIEYPGGMVNLIYENRPDTILLHQYGMAISIQKRLKFIQSYAGSSLVNNYQIEYSQSALEGKSLVSQVQECITDKCKQPLVFEWQDLQPSIVNHSLLGHGTGINGWQLVNLFGNGRQVYWTRNGSQHHATQLNDDGTVQNWSWNGHGTGIDGWQFVDLFGTGRQVYWTRNGSQHHATQLNDDGSVQNWSWNGHGTGIDGWKFVDLFGNGRQVYWTRNGSQHHATQLNSDGSVQNWSWSGHGTGVNGWEFADLFGTGRQVYWTRNGGQHYATQLNDDGSAQNWSWLGHGTGNDGWKLVDLFGNGRQVYWTRNGSQHHATQLNDDGSVQNWSWNGHGTGVNGWEFADLFGTGRQVYWTRNGGQHYATQLNDDGSAQNWSWLGHGTGIDGWKLVDLFGSGRQVYWTRNGSQHHATQLNDDGTAQNWSWNGHGTGVNGWQFADLFGTGRQVYWTRNSGMHHATSFIEKGSLSISNITDSSGNTTSLTYKPLTDNTIYTKGSGAQYPVVDLQYPQYVVSSVQSDNGVGGTTTVNYQYEGLKAHVRGRGSYGYSKITETYPDTGKTLETFYNQTAFPLAGYVDRVVEKYNGQVVNESDSTYATSESGGVHQVYLSQSVDKSYELNGNLITTVTTQNSSVDAYGNIGTVSVTTVGNNPVTGASETFAKTTQSTYTNDTTNWYLGRLTDAIVTHSAPGQANQQRRSTFAYDNATGLLDTQSIVSTVTGLPLTTTTYTYDNYGQKTEVRNAASGETDRVTTTSYDSVGRPTQTCNALNQCETYTYTPQGWLSTTTGPNSITTSWEYDGFGRKTKETRADGTETTIAHHFANPSSGTGSCGVLANHAYSCSVSQTTGSQPATVQYDSLGREIRKIATGFDGRLIYSDTEYNALAQVTRVSRNYFMGDQVYWANSEYDALNRVTSMDEPAPHGTRNTIATNYNGLVTTVTSGPEARQKATYTNAIGQVVRRTEEEGSYVDYTYSADGNLLTTTVAANADTTITLSYDEFGRKVGMDDPDMGVWSYSYNAFGQLNSQTDAKGQTTTMAFDVLGRMTSRTDLAGTANAKTSTWTYGGNTAPQGSIGKLLSTTDGAVTHTYYYDNLGRPEENNITTDVGTPEEHSFTTQTLYDSIGRVSRTIYPGSDNFYTENLYNANGFIEKVRGLRSNSEQYDLSQLTPLVTDAINLAANYQTQANELKTIGEYYETKIAEYQALIHAGTVSGSLDSGLQNNLTQHQTELNDQVAEADFDNAINEIYGTAGSDNYLLGGSGVDHIYPRGVVGYPEEVRSNDGNDILIFEAGDDLPLNVARDGDGHWRIRDFVIANVQTNSNADAISLGRLINVPNLNAQNIGDYLHVISNPYGWSNSRTGVFVNIDGGFTAADRAALDADVVMGGYGADLYLEFQGQAGNNNFATLTGHADNSVAQFQTLIDWGFLNLADTVPLTQDNGNTFLGHLNNTLEELQTVNDLINTQIQNYQDTVDQLVVLAEQTLAAADNSFQYERTLLRGGTAYTELVNDTQYTNYWTALDVDASGRISAEVYGNGIVNDYTYNQATGQLQHIHSSLLVVDPIRHLEYQYDAYQNVTSRHDHANDIRETFEYDRLDRLTRTDITSSTYTSSEFNGSQTQTYDVLGNITHKSDVGAYTYGQSSQYGTAGPHAVTTAGAATYTYDANGNMTSGDGRNVTWSSFNKPTLITRGNSSAEFSYGPNRARYKKVNHNGDTTLYMGKLYEHKTSNNGAGSLPTTEEKHYIYANGQLVAEHIVSTQHGVQTRYMHKDALGSVDLITDAHANVVDRRSFDAWGKLRNLTWRDGEGITNPLYLTQLPFTDKGYTGHEHIQEVGLIHMNGRVYDATLARFMSADPHIQEGALTQNYNRYSYVMNNPLKYTDPSGYFFKKVFRAIKRHISRVARAVVRHVKNVVNTAKKVLQKVAENKVLGTIASIAAAFYGGAAFANYLGFGAKTLSYKIAAGAVGGFAGSFVGSGGDLKAALIGGLTGVASGFIGGSTRFGAVGNVTARRVVAHGVVGGLSSVARGGKFGAGFISSSFTKIVSNPIQGFAERLAGAGTVAADIVGAMGAAIVGGTASVLGGGKFSNGAQTAAIQYLFNQVASKKPSIIERIKNFKWRGAIAGVSFGVSYTSKSLGYTFGFSYTGAAGTNGDTLTVSNLDIGMGTPGFEGFFRGVVGFNNTVDDLTGTAVSGSGSYGHKSFSVTAPVDPHPEHAMDFNRSPIFEGGFSTSRANTATATFAVGIGLNRDRWY